MFVEETIAESKQEKRGTFSISLLLENRGGRENIFVAIVTFSQQ
jgi:hypothetical protein